MKNAQVSKNDPAECKCGFICIFIYTCAKTCVLENTLDFLYTEKHTRGMSRVKRDLYMRKYAKRDSAGPRGQS